MKHLSKKFLCLLTCITLIVPAIFSQTTLAEDALSNTSTILFTHDLHSHFLPVKDSNGGEKGGYARLMTVLEKEREKHPHALTLDAGDFSIGSLIQTLYTSEAAELRTMGAMGYDATTIGNHEFDHTGTGFADMLNSAIQSGDRLPYIVDANYFPCTKADEGYSEDDKYIKEAMDNYGIDDYILIERGGITYGIFGVYGNEAHEDAPNSGFILKNPVSAAQATVDAIKAEVTDSPLFIIALSHSGTSDSTKNSEDEILAANVDGIDLIISGHSHTTLEAPIVVNNTYIVSCGEYSYNLGSITINWNSSSKALTEYKLIPIDENIEEDVRIASMIEAYKAKVGQTYLNGYNLTYDQILAASSFDLNTPSDAQEESPLGNLISDAYIYAVKQAEGDDYIPVTLAVSANGTIRASLLSGDITVSNVFDVLSMGVGNDGTSGFPLVSVYLTGRELKAVCEVDASVTPIMGAAQLYCSGIKYEFNKNRMFFNKITDTAIIAENGELSEIEDTGLYRVVTGMYVAQMLGTVKNKSFGLLSLVPKDANGNPITDFNSFIIYDKNGNEVKEWYALASYLQSFESSTIPEQYSSPDGRKLVTSSCNPINLLKNANYITLTACGIILLILTIIIFIIVKTALLIKKHRLKSIKTLR